MIWVEPWKHRFGGARLSPALRRTRRIRLVKIFPDRSPPRRLGRASAASRGGTRGRTRHLPEGPFRADQVRIGLDGSPPRWNSSVEGAQRPAEVAHLPLAVGPAGLLKSDQALSAARLVRTAG